MTSEEEEYCCPDGLLFQTGGERWRTVWPATHSVRAGVKYFANTHTVQSDNLKSW